MEFPRDHIGGDVGGLAQKRTPQNKTMQSFQVPDFHNDTFSLNEIGLFATGWQALNLQSLFHRFELIFCTVREAKHILFLCWDFRCLLAEAIPCPHYF